MTGGHAEKIAVAARVRPWLDSERAAADTSSVEPSITISAHGRQLGVRGPDAYEPRPFAVDAALGPRSTGAQLYDAVARGLVATVLDGEDAALIVYGGRGSGRTHCLLGGEGEEWGITARAAEALLARAAAAGGDGSDVSLAVSCLEVRDEALRDLLEPDARALFVRESAAHAAPAVFVDGQARRAVRSAAELQLLLRAAEAVRAEGRGRAGAPSASGAPSHAVYALHVLPPATSAHAGPCTLQLIDVGAAASVGSAPAGAASDRAARPAGVAEAAGASGAAGALAGSGVAPSGAQWRGASGGACGAASSADAPGPNGRALAAEMALRLALRALSEGSAPDWHASVLTRVLRPTLTGGCHVGLLLTLSAAQPTAALAALRFGQLAQAAVRAPTWPLRAQGGASAAAARTGGGATVVAAAAALAALREHVRSLPPPPSPPPRAQAAPGGGGARPLGAPRSAWAPEHADAALAAAAVALALGGGAAWHAAAAARAPAEPTPASQSARGAGADADGRALLGALSAASAALESENAQLRRRRAEAAQRLARARGAGAAARGGGACARGVAPRAHSSMYVSFDGRPPKRSSVRRSSMNLIRLFCDARPKPLGWFSKTFLASS